MYVWVNFHEETILYFENDIKKQYFSQKSRAPTNETPHSSRRSITSDYETSSILDSASMYGGDDTSTSSPPVRSQIQQQREVNVDEHLASKNTSNKKKTKEPLPTIITTKATDSPVLTDRSRSFDNYSGYK